MDFDHRHYVPCVRWKRGEYQAVLRLPDTTKRAFTPLIEVPEIGWDFEKEIETKTIDEHLAPFAKRVAEKWGKHSCFVDLHLIVPNERMHTGIHPVCFVFDGLRERKCSAIPVTGLDRDNVYQQEIKNVATHDKSGVCLRIKIEQAAKGSLKSEFSSLLSRLKVKPESCDLIIDLGAPNFIPLEGFSKAIEAIVSRFPHLNDWRTFTLLGTSFPETMASIKKGGQIFPRLEWQLYMLLVANFQRAGLRIPAFADYAISHPKVLIVDMRTARPSATIRYTIDNSWYIVKGENVRDYGYKQYRGLSGQVQFSRHYSCSTFSWGDQYIQNCANGSVSTGNLTTWRQVGTNHHITKVTQDIASFYAS
jgi:hypothetical protein